MLGIRRQKLMDMLQHLHECIETREQHILTQLQTNKDDVLKKLDSIDKRVVDGETWRASVMAVAMVLARILPLMGTFIVALWFLFNHLNRGVYP